MIERWIELLKQSGKNTKQQVIKEMEEYLNNQPKILYVCDTRSCDKGHCDICHHTDDIKHAANFKQVAPGVFEEQC